MTAHLESSLLASHAQNSSGWPMAAIFLVGLAAVCFLAWLYQR